MDKNQYKNPFSLHTDRHQIWEMLVERDIIAFCQQDWSMIQNDFIEESFMGIDGSGKDNPDTWTLNFATLEAYKIEWLQQAEDFNKTGWAEDYEAALYRATNLRDIDVQGHVAVAHKKFDGQVNAKDGTSLRLNWQTLYRCQKVDGQWRIQGFTGYLPFPMGGSTPAQPDTIRIPEQASQHVTAGPYSPVLEINPAKLVVISGQASIDLEGKVLGDTIEEQTHLTMQNCAKQLADGGCTLNDVFKCNVYLTDLDNWPRFNEVYKTYFDQPLPVRTAVQTPLLMTLLVEIEMWAAKPFL